MEHGQQTGESIGAMLSSIASTLREVSEKLDAVAARIDGTSAVPGEQTIEARLAKLEAWVAQAGRDISGIDARVERLESSGSPAPNAPGAADRSTRLPRGAARPNAGQPERATAEPAPAARKSDSPEPAASRNGARPLEIPREPVHAAPEPYSSAQSGFTPPREPAMTTREPKDTSGQHFTPPAPREQPSTFTAPPAQEPVSRFTTPATREPASFTAPSARPIGSSASYSQQENAAYESIIASSTSADRGADRSGSRNGTAPDAPVAGLTGARHATEEDRTPVENTHVDKLQAMLDELKRTAAAPLGRSDIFGPPAGEPTTNGYQ
ncbi:hypothetical protein [Nocardia pneumoniae]|uniref:hypothetical protein n=1 Tax=Nocardia pneumoniae TaxID=228601 RepID=UPI0002D2C67F|nr:hypothetical protein [Nocardia pneumoniae]